MSSRRGSSAIRTTTWGVVALVATIGTAFADTPPQRTDDDLKPAVVELNGARNEILVEGDFAEGTARRLRSLLRTNPAIRVVSLASDGGLVDEADQVGDIVAAHGLATLVRDGCVSACTLAFVRGRERIVLHEARLGFHAPWIPGEGGKEEQVGSDDERQAYLAAGIASDFVAEALAVPAASVWFPGKERLLRAQVVTAVLSAEELPARIATLGEPRRLAAAGE